MTKHQTGIIDAFLELFDDGPQRVSRAKPKKSKRGSSWLDFFAGRHTFIVEMTDHGWSGYQCECLLRKYGIPVKNRFVCVGKEGDMMPPYISLSVARKQAAWAEYILFRAGVPVISPTFDGRNEQHRATALRDNRSLPPGGWGGTKRDFTTWLIDFLTPIMGFVVGDYGHSLPVEQRRKPRTKPRRVRK